MKAVYSEGLFLEQINNNPFLNQTFTQSIPESCLFA